MIWNKIFKYLEKFSKDRKTREKVLIKTFARKNSNFDYANKWHVPLLIIRFYCYILCLNP